MPILIKAIVFIVVSTGLVWLSRRSLQRSRPHGFYRLLAWEAILALILLNVDYWFTDLFCPRQIVSWCLLIICVVPAAYAYRSLRVSGKPTVERQDNTLIGVERTSALVTTGAYRYIRHPMYCSLLLLAWGAFLKRPSWVAVVFAVASTLFLIATARKEEKENLRFFGLAYRDYMERTKMFVPLLF
jgi:protein-S-isoprenylcysteine O-methyltransferase Ste14